jgi:SAM-dependent methyltransferase
MAKHQDHRKLGLVGQRSTRVLPQVPALAGSAEQIPLDDDSVDVVLVAQAWHWVDPGQAVPEVARVLSAGGRLGLLWNVRDERHDWVARLGQILAAHTEPDMNTSGPLVGPPFAEVERFEVEWTHYLAPIALMDLVASRSYVITLGPQERNRVLGQVRDLLHTHPDLVGRDQFALPYLTRCHRADLLG